MIIPNDPDKFLSSWKYLETAKYVQSLGRVIRQKDGDNTLFIEAKDKEFFRQQNGNIGLYTSIWHYNSTDLDKAIRLGSLYFDIDNKDPHESYIDCIKLYNYLINYIPKSAVLVYFTGKKGFHIECEAITLGINPSNNLPNIFRFIASTLKDKLKLESLDFSVYDARRMWRLEGSKHQDTNLYKNLIPEDTLSQGMDRITDYCTVPSSNEVSEQNFNAKANEWFREFTYNMEIEKEKSKDFMGYFNKYGSTAFKQVDVKEKEFTPDKLLKSCTSIARLQQQAIEKKYLEHEARLFLCSILTYNEESIKFLHGILSNCSDYNVEKTNSHVNDWIKRRELGIGGRPYTCERANSAGVGCGECSLEKKNKWVKIGDKYVETQEQSSPSPVRFAYRLMDKGGEHA
jgi:hypothetical protein